MVDLELALHAFHDELSKEAAVPWQQIGRAVGGLGGAGAVVGAAANGLREGVNGYNEAREQGASGVTSGLNALSRGGSGAITGGVLGGALGGVGGAVGSHFNAKGTQALVDKALKTPGLAAGARFGQRQVHGLTGWRPTEGLESIGVNGIEGMTSLPDVARGLKKDPIGTLRKGVTGQWKNSDRLGKVMMGLSAADLGYSVLGPEDPQRGRGERIGGSLAGLASHALTPLGMPIGAQMLGSSALHYAGSRSGRLLDKKPPPSDESAELGVAQ
jgi:hypothetical protein